MGGAASTNLTNAFCANPTAQGAVCGAQSTTLATANLPNNTYTPVFTGTLGTTSSVVTSATVGSVQAGAGSTVLNGESTGGASYTPAGTINTYQLNGGITQTAFSKVQPTLVLNYIIKVLPDTNSAIASGVTSLGLMTGDIACGNGLVCTGNTIAVTGGAGGTAAGATTNIQYNTGGLFDASANLTFTGGNTLNLGVPGSMTGVFIIGASGSGSLTQTVQTNAGSPTITWGTSTGTPAVIATSPLAITASTGSISCPSCSNNSLPLSQFASTTSSQLYGVMSDPTGTAGQIVFSNTPTLTTPVLGVATATSINGLTITNSTGTLTITNAKTAAISNSLTLAGTDATTITFQGTDTYVGRATTDTLTNKTFDTAGTGNAFKIAGTSITSIAGNTAIVGTVSGSLISGNCLRSDANHNIVDAGGACTTGGGGGTVSSGTSGQLTYYGSTGTTVSGNANFTVSAGTLTAGIAGSVQGNVAIAGVTSGATTLTTAAAASGTLTLPAATDTLVGRATTDTLTNKTLTAPIIATISNSGTLTLPTGANTLVARATTDTLTNKTLDTASTGNVFKINGTQITSISGNTAKVVTATGAYTNGDCASFDASGNLADNGSACYALPTYLIYVGCTIGGSVDCSSLTNTALSSCASAGGGRIVLPAGTILFNAGIVFPSGSSGCELAGAGTYQEFTGTAGTQLATNFPVNGTVIYQTSTSNCAITTGGTNVNHVYIHDLAFRQSQPADANGFSPTAYKPSVCGGSQTDMERLFFWNVYKGIQVGTTATQATGRTRINNISGTCFAICVDVQFSADFGWVNNVECAPFMTAPGGVTTGQNNYVSTHSTCVSLERVDEWTLQNINVFSMKNGIVENHTTDGDANWVHVNDYHCDGCQQGILINGCAQMTFSNVLILGTGTVAGSVGVNVPGTGSCTTTTNILTFSNLNIHGPGNQCIAANVVDISVTNYECFAFNGAATGTAGTTMNAGAVFTAGGRYNINNQGNTGGGGGGNTSGAGTFNISHVN